MGLGIKDAVPPVQVNREEAQAQLDAYEKWITEKKADPLLGPEAKASIDAGYAKFQMIKELIGGPAVEKVEVGEVAVALAVVLKALQQQSKDCPVGKQPKTAERA